MNDIQIFNNAEFGEIRSVKIDGEPWFVGKDIAEALGYKDSSDAIKRHVDDEDKYQVKVGEIPTLKISNYGANLINESGVYALIFGSKLESAKKFKKWVTSEVLPSIRKTGSYQMPMTNEEKLLFIMETQKEVYERVGAVEQKQENFEHRLDEIQNDLPILPIEADKIVSAVKSKGVQLMGGKTSNAYNDRSVRQKVYNAIYGNLKYNFGVKSYKSIKRSQTDKAIEIIDKFELPIPLQENIENTNLQMSFA